MHPEFVGSTKIRNHSPASMHHLYAMMRRKFTSSSKKRVAATRGLIGKGTLVRVHVKTDILNKTRMHRLSVSRRLHVMTMKNGIPGQMRVSVILPGDVRANQDNAFADNAVKISIWTVTTVSMIP